MAEPPPGPGPPAATRVPLLVDKLTDGVVDAAYTAIVAADEAAARVQAVFEPVLRADWTIFSPVRSEASQLLERGAEFRRTATAAAKAAGRRNWAPAAGSATSNSVTGGVVHAPNERSNGLWQIQALPSDADTTRGAWLTRVKLQQARLTESSQSELQVAAGDASASLRAVLAAAEREAQAEVGRAQGDLDRRLAQSNAALALRLAQVDARRAELQARAVAAARQELQGAGVAQPSARQVAVHFLQRIGMAPHPGAAAERPCHADEVEAAMAAAGFPAMRGASGPHEQPMPPPECNQPPAAPPVDAAQRLREEGRSRVEALSRQARQQAEQDAASARGRVPPPEHSPAAGQVSPPAALARPADMPLAASALPTVAVRVDAVSAPRTPTGSPLGATSPVFDVSLGAASAQSFSVTDAASDAPASAPGLADGQPLAAKLASDGPRKTGARKR